MSDQESPFNALMVELRTQHRELDLKIEELQLNPYADQLQLRRLKKEKLSIKDRLERLRNDLIPDLNA